MSTGDSASRVRIAGVPEHYNAPFLIYPEMFREAGVELDFQQMAGGTGAMVSALRSGSVDMAVALTEGLVADIALKGSNDYLIVSPYVSIPLRWGIWVRPDSALQSADDLRGSVFGISRLGSGSHLMAAVLYSNAGWDPASLRLSAPCGSLDGLVTSLTAAESDAFLWSYSMTKPLADAGRVRHLGDLYTPWPCFMIAVRRDFLETRRALVQTVLRVVKQAAARFLAGGSASVDWVCATYGIARGDAEDWFATLGFATKNHVSDEVLGLTIRTLRSAAVITSKPERGDLVAELAELPWQLQRDESETYEAFLHSPTSSSGVFEAGM